MKQNQAIGTERKLFETWYVRNHPSADIRRDNAKYANVTTWVAWRAWQARAGVSEDVANQSPRDYVEQFTRMAHARKDVDAFQALIDKAQPL